MTLFFPLFFSYQIGTLVCCGIHECVCGTFFCLMATAPGNISAWVVIKFFPRQKEGRDAVAHIVPKQATSSLILNESTFSIA